MEKYTEGCLICGKPIHYFEQTQKLACHICGAVHDTNAACEDGHYICDSCHAVEGFVFIRRYAGATSSKDPMYIATEMMKDRSINMHGPEHHYLIPAALLAAYKNAGGKIDFEKALQSAGQRAKNVPGGICGMWGSCGAGIATGIFISIITGATPISEIEWSLANRMTSKSLSVIAANGGPRCCKRNTYLAITEAAAFAREKFGINMEIPPRTVCQFSRRNKQCRNEKCLYSPDSV